MAEAKLIDLTEIVLVSTHTFEVYLVNSNLKDVKKAVVFVLGMDSTVDTTTLPYLPKVFSGGCSKVVARQFSSGCFWWEGTG